MSRRATRRVMDCRIRLLRAVDFALVSDKDIAAAFALSVQSVNHLRKRAAVWVDKPPAVAADQRNQRMVAMYSQGKTLQEIGDEFGVSRERVRQCISEYGIAAHNGGAAIRAKTRQSAARQMRVFELEASALRDFGCSYDEAMSLNDGFTLYAARCRSRQYRQQRSSAVLRGITFSLTFPEWCAIWDASGKYPLRGRGASKYCMARIDDAKGYEVGNVKIVTNKENIAESFLITPSVIRHAQQTRIANAKAAQAISLKAGGKSNKEISEILGVSRTTVSQYLCAAKRYPALEMAA